jgi:septum formation protein
MSSPRLVILATQSKQRQELFAALGIPFQAKPADIDELAVDAPDHAVRAALVAEAKSATIQALYPQAIIIAADTFVVFNHQRLEKPNTMLEATQMLTALSGQTFDAFTGWSYTDPQLSLHETGTAKTEVSFRRLSKSDITTYVEEQPVTTWAGGFFNCKCGWFKFN